MSSNAHHDTSPALRDLKDTHTRGTAHSALHLPRHGGQSDTKGNATGGTGSSAALVPSTSTNWEGVGQGFSGPNGTFSVNSAPPDTDGAVGPSNYVQIVNSDFAVFSKTGTVLYGPVSTNTLWSGFGGGCQTNNDGDATAVYDRAANRFVISQFSVSTTPYLQCVAVSTTGDPTGSYYRYSFSYSNFPDYPKLSVWPDAYYTTFNMFNSAGTVFFGAEIAAYDRNAMLSGQAATQQTFMTSSTYGGLLGANVDSSTLPAAGTPEWILGLGATASHLAYWKFHVDWTTPANTTFTGPTEFATQTWSELCGGGTCVPQSGTTQQLDSLADRVMYNFGYRNFGDHESLVISHSVVAGSGGGIAWYELRPSAGNLSIYQQGIYAPDSNYRWMPSIAMDGSGDVGLGFSLSGSSLHPAIHYSGRLAADPLGTMSQGESSIIDGAGSQVGNIIQPLSRWGDYSQMSIDPSDDCTFWYTNQYEASSGSFNWHTRIGSFKFAGCGSTASDFSIGVSPTSQTVTAGGSTSYTVTTSVTSGSATTVSLSASGLPAGASASFNPASVTAGGSSTMTVTTSSSTPAGTSTITVTGTGAGGSPTHTATTGLTVNAPPANDFSVSVSPSSQTVTAGGSTSYTVSTAVTSGNAVTVSFSASGLPAGATATFTPGSVTAGSSSTLSISTATTTAAGSYTFTVTGSGPGGTPSHSTTATLVVNAAPNDFSISVSPSSESATAGQSTPAYTVSTAVTSGLAGSVTLSASGLPSGATASFGTNPVTAGNSSTMTIATASTTPAGTYTITVTGTEGAASHSATTGLTVNAPPANPVVNGGFETGNLSGWTATGVFEGVTSSAHSGSYAAQLGQGSTTGDSSIAQTFTIPSGATTLTFWWFGHCRGSGSYAGASLKDNTSGTTATVLGNTCSNSGAWSQVTYSVSALVGHSVTLTLKSHNANTRRGNYTYFDDVAIA